MKHSQDDPRRSLRPPSGGRDDLLGEVIRKKSKLIGWICIANWYNYGKWHNDLRNGARQIISQWHSDLRNDWHGLLRNGWHNDVQNSHVNVLEVKSQAQPTRSPSSQDHH